MQDVIHYVEGWNDTSIIIRLILSTLFGCFIGMERATKRQIAGIKTFALVCLGSAIATIVNIYLWDITAGGADTSRIPAGVVSGIGFLGVGTIVVTGKNQVRGLTTAASLWVTATLGLCIGAGMIVMSTVAFVLLLVIVHFLQYLNHYQRESSRYIGLYLEVHPGNGFKQFMEYVKQTGYSITSLEKKRTNKNSDVSVLVELDMGCRRNHHEIIADFGRVDGIRYLEEI